MSLSRYGMKVTYNKPKQPVPGVDGSLGKPPLNSVGSGSNRTYASSSLSSLGSSSLSSFSSRASSEVSSSEVKTTTNSTTSVEMRYGMKVTIETPLFKPKHDFDLIALIKLIKKPIRTKRARF